MKKIVIAFSFVLSTSVALGQVSKSFTNQIHISWNSVSRMNATTGGGAIHDTKLTFVYLPTVEFDSNTQLSLYLGYMQDIRNAKVVLNYSRSRRVYYGLHIAQRFKLCDSYPLQLGLYGAPFNGTNYFDNNSMEETYNTKGFESGIYLAPILTWGCVEFLPKVTLKYQKFTTQPTSEYLMSQLGLQLNF